jgi:septal ring factor EnvC (AmiA/AmiB activator)
VRARSRWLALGLVCVAAALARADVRDPLGEQLEVVVKTEAMLADSEARRAELLRQRVRAIYKLSRAGWAQLWIDHGARTELLRRRAAARRLLTRDLAELAILDDEAEAVGAARVRLEHALAIAAPPPPGRGSLVAPVPGAVVRAFGRFRDTGSRVRRVNRGLALRARPGEPVIAPAAGVVAFAGPARGLGQVVVIHAEVGAWVVLARLGELAVETGAKVSAGDRLGGAADAEVQLEVRLPRGAGSTPIDPAPMLGR